MSDPSESLFEVLAELDLPEAATAVATDAAGRARLWAYRERHTEAISALGVPHKLDVTLPQSRLAEFEPAVRRVVAETAPGSTLVLFGHVGDGNLHVNVVGPPPEDETVDEAVLRLVASMDGSISAEHGIGRAKVPLAGPVPYPGGAGRHAGPQDGPRPRGLLNPGVLLASEASERATAWASPRLGRAPASGRPANATPHPPAAASATPEEAGSLRGR